MKFLSNYRWGFGLGAAAVAAAVMLIMAVTTPEAKARALDIMARGARAAAQITSIHMRGQLRTLPADNFSYIGPDDSFETVELWKEYSPVPKWRMEKPGRVALMDGQSTLLFIKPSKRAVKVPAPTASAFDTQWLHTMANLSGTISNELVQAKSRGWKLGLEEKNGPDGKAKAVVTVHAASGVPDQDYLKNKFFDNADTRRVYWFDVDSERLEAVQVFLQRDGKEIQILDLNEIEYNVPIAPAVWSLELPPDVSWHQDPQKLPDNEKYASMSAEDAARTFFEACGREDWVEAGKFMGSLNESTKNYLGGLTVVNLGKGFTATTYSGKFVPYEIQLRPMEINVRMSNDNPAKRYVMVAMHDRNLKLEEDAPWPSPPQVLLNNANYAAMTPAAAAKAGFDATAKLDFEEMAKFIAPAVVAKFKQAVVEAEKAKLPVSQVLPTFEPGEAFWSAEHSAWFVKCKMTQPIRKHNLALRKDNPAKRWQVDGGI